MHVCLAVQSCPALCETLCFTPPGSFVHGIFQAKYWSGLPFPSPGDLPNPGIKPRSPAMQAYTLPSEPPGEPQEVTKAVTMAIGVAP